MGLPSHLPISAHAALHQEFFYFILMHPIGPELPISAHVASARVCRQLYVWRASHALVQATVGAGARVGRLLGLGTRLPPPPPPLRALRAHLVTKGQWLPAIHMVAPKAPENFFHSP